LLDTFHAREKGGGKDEDVWFECYIVKCVKKYLFVSQLTSRVNTTYIARIKSSSMYYDMKPIIPSLTSYLNMQLLTLMAFLFDNEIYNTKKKKLRITRRKKICLFFFLEVAISTWRKKFDKNMIKDKNKKLPLLL
jgi:hypothetical protein